MRKLGTLILGAILTLGIGAGISFKPNTDVAHAASYTATYVAGENASDATVNGIDAMKVGTSKKGGNMSIKVGAGATSLTFYAAAWKGVTGLSITLNNSTFNLTADDGITGNPPFILTGDAEGFKFTTALSNITTETTLNVTSSSAKRYVIWGAEYTSDIVPDAPTTTPEPELVNVSTIDEAINHSAAEMTQKFAIKGVEVTGWKDSNTDGTKFGNFNISDGTQTILVYGATANKDNIEWDEINAIYKFPDSFDFLENELTKQITIGSELDLTFLVTSYKGTKQLKAIVTSVNNENVEDDPIEPKPDTPVEPEDPEVPGDTTYGYAYEKSVTIAEYAAANGWTDATQYTSIALDDNITVTATGGENTGKYYTSGENWRIYQTENPTITISTANSWVLSSVTINYNINKSGVLTHNGSNITTGTEVAINNTQSIEFSVGNTGDATNGQVRITSITVEVAIDTTTATGVATAIKHMAGGWDNEVTTENCYNNYAAANELVLALSAEEKETFKTSTDTEIASARKTYEHWCFVNGAEAYEETVPAGSRLSAFNNSNNMIIIVVAISSLVILATAGLLISRKRRYSK